MKEKRLALVSGITLVLIGSAAALVRYRAAGKAYLSPGDSAWRLSYDLEFEAKAPGARIALGLPESGRHIRVFREEFSHPGLAMDIVRGKKTGGREAVAVSLSGGGTAHRIKASFDLHLAAHPNGKAGGGPVALSTKARSYFLRSEEAVQVASREVREVSRTLVGERASHAQLVERAFEFCYAKIAKADRGAPSDAVGAIVQERAGLLGRARAMVAICRAGRVPARLVAGFVLDDDSEAHPNVWVEYRIDKRWIACDPTAGHRWGVPDTYLTVRRDAFGIIRSQGVTAIKARFEIRRLYHHPDLPSVQGDGLANVLVLTRLTPGMQHTLAILLLLPLGALITAIFRNMVGLQTFGTFTPGLLALSFVYSDWRTGLLVFVMVMIVGLLSRQLLEKIKLLMVPRLGLIMTIVVLCMVMAVSIFDHLGITPSARAVVLPVVILTMMIERLHIKSQEDGLRQAARQLLNTFAVAAVCLLVLRWQWLGRLALTYPEGQLFVAAALIAVGRYAGYRLSELIRFRDLARLDAPDGAK